MLLTFESSAQSVARIIVKRLQWRERQLRRLAAMLERGRDDPAALPVIPALAGEAAIGAACAIVRARILAGDTEAPLVALANELTCVLVYPYLGVWAAVEELERPGDTPLDPGRAVKSR